MNLTELKTVKKTCNKEKSVRGNRGNLKKQQFGRLEKEMETLHGMHFGNWSKSSTYECIQ